MATDFFDKLKKVYFLAITVLMYYFLTEILNLGIFITFRHVFALIIFFSGFVLFLIKPDVPRGITASKDALVYSAPLLITIVVSLFIWFATTADVDIIARGLSGAFIYTNMLSFAFAAAAILYIFGENGIWYNLVAILIANILMIGTVILQNGIGPYFSELITLITTFAAETGDIIVQAEVHEFAFCLGAYLIYMFFKPQKSIVFYILLALTLFCFVSAFKRIGILAIAVALAFAYVLKFIAKYHPKLASNLALGLGVIIVVALVAYIAIIKLGAFDLLEEIGINTSGRVDIYNAVDKYYEFSPEYIGKGIGFLTYQLSSSTIGVSSVHNDFLQYFIDLGFWGYLLWLASMTVLRIGYFGHKGKTENAILCFALILYLIIVSTTDNTMNYPLLTAVLAVLMIGHGFDEKVEQTRMKIFGYRK